MIVDDDKIVSLLLKNQMKKGEIKEEPILCGNGKEAWDIINGEEEPETIFIVLLDLNMPVMNGWDFLGRCKKMPCKNKIFVVVITSSTYKEDLFKASNYKQVIGVFNKPITLGNVKAIKELEEIKFLLEVQ